MVKTVMERGDEPVERVRLIEFAHQRIVPDNVRDPRAVWLILRRRVECWMSGGNRKNFDVTTLWPMRILFFSNS